MAGLNKVSVDDINVKGKHVLVRCDFNVPLKDGVITNDNRIQAALPTIKKLIADGGKVVLCSHLGKPKNGPEDKFSLAPVAKRLAELVDTKVIFAKDDNVVGENAKKAVAEMKDGEIVLLENTRFRGAEETKNGEAFSKELADLVNDEVFVMDAIRFCTPCACFYCRRDQVCEGDRCRLSDAEGDSVPGQCCRGSGSSLRCNSGRRKGGRQAERNFQSDRKV